ncbi:hypothetical protein [Acinetobacter sp. BSP-28]|uniref:hypothetical protein n=1 Tax=Acinetobacter sp. BSP-28 TaxID=3344661 RepID=UPI00376FDBC6
MSEFEQWFRSLNANEKTVYFLGNEHKVSEMAWNHQQAKIDELKKKIEDQIDILKAASKSHAYNYREQNIMLSQADDLEKILRGEHE